MTTVKEIAFKYAAKGADAARRADRRVRDSVNDTAKTAQRESGTIGRWMERHRSAVQMIGVATLGVMGAIVSASPTMRAELAGVRIAFSLFADTVVNDALPAGWSLVDLVFRLEEAYRELPTPVREGTSALLFWGGVVAGVALAAATAQKIIAGTFVAKGLAIIAGAAAGAGSAVLGVVSSILFLGAVAGGVVGIFGVWLLHITGVLDRIRTLGSVTASETSPALLDLGLSFLAVASFGVLPLMSVLGAFITGVLEGGFPKGVERAREALGVWRDAMRRTVDRAKQWGKDLISELIAGIMARIPDLISAVNRARQVIESRLSFDIIANDRAARRWGSDLLEEMAVGAESAQSDFASSLSVPVPDAPSGSGGGSNATVIIEQGAIQVDGAGSPRRTAERTADEVSQTIQDDFGARR